MKSSNLEKIIKRLQAMTIDETSGRQKRMFGQFGIPLCDVTYIRSSDEFVFIRYRPHERFRFDDIDLVAIEVFNCLYDFKHTF
ncbi:YkuJ family protein [Limosilactobacillus fastidiosus]|uniref:YkuJ family protein n=1 Tax=Limosilactobacillus fastidiosus TaxID=2759855 RepID=A0A7W3YBV7_9LACO|nr:YkuJ family protein [Limosilactobacillus fastidiosus]MBB1085337.1 YkuJ family protein [Limosilactobacillus fastidiosus]MCD7084935.1 YkuJ family protein [Limosilactobacillus fastidiosus]MCD7113751.1 YkuJ family protein [Limosilactobacillus fastidiosus]MCD7115393.1 YkuJ family protein [Limosilactobacillus fastidiosus]